MGVNDSIEERQYKYQALHNGIYEIEKDILEDLKNPAYESKKYRTYGLINKNICKNYPYLLKDTFDFNLTMKYNFNYKDLPHSNEDKDFKIIHPKFSFNFPINFIFINEDFMYVLHDNVLDKKVKDKLVSKFDTIIGGGCLIMKNPNDTKSKNPFRYIILYRDIKDNEGNEIDFFLYINDKTKRENTVDYILQNGLFNFFKNINYSYKENYKIFADGYIVRSCPKTRIESYLKKLKQKMSKNPTLSNNPNIPPNNNLNYGQNDINANFGNNHPASNPADNIKGIQQKAGKDKRVENYATAIERKNYPQNNPDLLLNAAISFLFSIDEIKKYICQNKNIDFQSFKTLISTNIGHNIKDLLTYEKIFTELLEKVDPNNLINKDYYNQTNQYDEEKGRKYFLEKHKNGTVIQKMFLIPTEEKIFCNNCRMDTFFFYFSKFIILKNSQSNLLNQTLFGSEKENKEGKYCNFCNGRITTLTIEKKYLNLPEWLIVIVEPSQINNLMINSILLIINGNNIIYTLLKFIEAKTNSLYFINLKNTQFCNKFDNTRFYENEKIANKKVAVLFYKLNQNFNNMNLLNNNIQNESNQNNNFINNGKANAQQNANIMNPLNMNQPNNQQQKINIQDNSPIINNSNSNQQQPNKGFNLNQQNMINMKKQNNIQNANQVNMEKMNNGQNFNHQNAFSQPNIIPSQNGQNMNMNNAFNNNLLVNNNLNQNMNIANNFNQMNNMGNMQINNMNMNNMNNNMNNFFDIR